MRPFHARRPRSLLFVLALLATFAPAVPPANASGVSTTLDEVREWVGAARLGDLGITGAGIDVAVIDTGVEPIAGLDGPNKLVVGPDLSFEAGVPELYGHDTYGHGTVMASIIAGNDGGGYGGFRGVAPGARIVSVKVADNTGAVDVSQVIAALEWITDNGRSNGLNVRVINLSYVTDSDQDYLIDPLAMAVERAWKAGYVVVVAAGNNGSDTEVLGNPAADPYVIAVAAANRDGHTDFTNRGSDTRRPDVLAPGEQILGLAAPNSRLVQEHPGAFIGGRYLRGSGTSQAAAVVSGAAALMLEERPGLTPDQVKALLIMGTVDKDGNGNGNDLDAIKGMSKYFDLLDAEALLRAEAREFRTAAAAKRHDAEVNLENAAILWDEAAQLWADANLLFAQADALFAEAHELDGDAEKAVKAEAEIVEDEAKLVKHAAEDTDKAAEELEHDAAELLKKAGEDDEDAAKVDTKADEVRAQAESQLVPEHIKQSERAADYRAEAVELRAEAALLLEQAAPLRVAADARYADAEPHWATVADLLTQAEPYFAEAQPYFDEAKRLKAEAKALEEEAKDASDSKAEQLEAEADALKDEARALEDMGKAIEQPGEDLVDQAKDVEGLAKDIEKDAKAIDDQAKKLENAADDLEEDAAKAERDAAEADAASASALAQLEADIAAMFASWDGRGFGAIGFDDQGGAGMIDVERSSAVPAFEAHQVHAPATGSGSLEAARGTNHVTMPDGTLLTGEVTFTGSSWSGSSWSGSSWSGSSWSGSSWSGSSWSGSSWSGSSWSGSSWSGSSWSGSSWSGSSWSGSSWSGSSWSGSSWSGSSWSGSSWA